MQSQAATSKHRLSYPALSTMSTSVSFHLCRATMQGLVDELELAKNISQGTCVVLDKIEQYKNEFHGLTKNELHWLF
jgi:hypothetical protein